MPGSNSNDSTRQSSTGEALGWLFASSVAMAKATSGRFWKNEVPRASMCVPLSIMNYGSEAGGDACRPPREL